MSEKTGSAHVGIWHLVCLPPEPSSCRTEGIADDDEVMQHAPRVLVFPTGAKGASSARYHCVFIGGTSPYLTLSPSDIVSSPDIHCCETTAICLQGPS
jgi:hypothetical protein